MTWISENFEGTFFHLIFVGSPPFFVFQNTKSSSQIWIQMSYGKNFYPHGNCFKKIDYFWKFCFQIFVFDKRQVKSLHTRKRKLQEEIPESLEQVVKEFRESRSQLLCW